jgi:hypothetical protein
MNFSVRFSSLVSNIPQSVDFIALAGSSERPPEIDCKGLVNQLGQAILQLGTIKNTGANPPDIRIPGPDDIDRPPGGGPTAADQAAKIREIGDIISQIEEHCKDYLARDANANGLVNIGKAIVKNAKNAGDSFNAQGEFTLQNAQTLVNNFVGTFNMVVNYTGPHAREIALSLAGFTAWCLAQLGNGLAGLNELRKLFGAFQNLAPL